MELVRRAEGGHNVRQDEQLPTQTEIDSALAECYQFILKCRAKRKGQNNEKGSDLRKGING